jgi:hypothetical protein
VQLMPTLAERIFKTLLRSCSETVKRNGKACNAHFRHSIPSPTAKYCFMTFSLAKRQRVYAERFPWTRAALPSVPPLSECAAERHMVVYARVPWCYADRRLVTPKVTSTIARLPSVTIKPRDLTEALQATASCSFGVAGVVVLCEASSNPAGYGVRWCDGALGCAQGRGSSREPVLCNRRT